jgi:hypothetical protein
MNAKETTNEKEKEAVRQLLRSAFPPVGERKDLRPLTHEECVEMRSGIISLEREYIQYYLPQILIDLIETHVKTSVNDSADLVRILDLTMDNMNYDAVERLWGRQGVEDTHKQESELRRWKTEMYASFSSEQAHAICKWLELAKSWEDLQLYQKDVDAALRYWRKRAFGDENK